jgi:transcriptional regulator of acetoin/glycerol metabolism
MACDEHQDAVLLSKVKTAAAERPKSVQVESMHDVSNSGFADARGNAGVGSSKIVPLAEVERQTILTALERLNGNKLLTARALGIGKTTLYRKLKAYGICPS